MSSRTFDWAWAPDRRVALVTCNAFPDLYVDDLSLRDTLGRRGLIVDAVRWDDPTADWATYDMAVLRSTWDYVSRRDEFVAWAHRVPRLMNPADIVEWNTDKHYLIDLAWAGVPTVPTAFVEPGEAWSPPAEGEWVIKPAVSVGSQDTGRYLLPAQTWLARAHVDRLTSAGRTAMVQPYLGAVDSIGETAVLFLPDSDGHLSVSHGARKSAMLRGPDTGKVRDLAEVATQTAGEQVITSRQPTRAEIETATMALAAIPGGSAHLLYARVDLIPSAGGRPLLVELELVEPSLYFRTAPNAAARMANAIATRLIPHR